MRVIKRTDLPIDTSDEASNNAPGFQLIVGKINAGELKKHISDSLGLSLGEDSVQTFANNLVEADKLLKNGVLRNIDWKLTGTYNLYVSKINNRTLTKKDVKNGANKIEECVYHMYDKI